MAEHERGYIDGDYGLLENGNKAQDKFVPLEQAIDIPGPWI